MFISKFDLYETEWLDRVFQGRNKEYGAYNLRQQYGNNMVKAMAITFFGVGVLIGASIIFKPHVVDKPYAVPFNPPTPVVPAVPPVKPLTHPKIPKPEIPVKTTAFVPFVVKPDGDAKKTTPNDEIRGDIGSEAIDGPPSGGGDPMPVESGGTGTAALVIDETVHMPIGLEAMPEPIGGDAAWNKFLSKNLRYPNEAQDIGASGRVIISFVVEKDGHLSNVIVERAAGHGFDEETLRVLKLAKAWKPGIQNGQPVRVKYTIPINFQAAE